MLGNAPQDGQDHVRTVDRAQMPVRLAERREVEGQLVRMEVEIVDAVVELDAHGCAVLGRWDGEVERWNDHCVFRMDFLL